MRRGERSVRLGVDDEAEGLTSVRWKYVQGGLRNVVCWSIWGSFSFSLGGPRLALRVGWVVDVFASASGIEVSAMSTSLCVFSRGNLVVVACAIATGVLRLSCALDCKCLIYSPHHYLRSSFES